MLYEFAIIPDVFEPSLIDADSALSLAVIEILRGISENGLVANLNNDEWAKYVQQERVSGLSAALRDKILACLTLLYDRHRLVRHPQNAGGNPTTDQDWLALAIDSDRLTAFHGIVLSDALLSSSAVHPSLLGLSKVLDSAQWLTRRRSITIHKTFAEYQRILTHLLRYAKALSLVDPYLNAHEPRYTGVIDLCSSLMGNNACGHSPGRIDVHTHINNQKPIANDTNYYINQWRILLGPLALRDGHRFRLFIWRGRPGRKNFHDRFILTDQCGVSIPAGLDARAVSTFSTTWSLLDEEDRRLNLDDYDVTISPFQIVPPTPVDVP